MRVIHRSTQFVVLSLILAALSQLFGMTSALAICRTGDEICFAPRTQAPTALPIQEAPQSQSIPVREFMPSDILPHSDIWLITGNMSGQQLDDWYATLYNWITRNSYSSRVEDAKRDLQSLVDEMNARKPTPTKALTPVTTPVATATATAAPMATPDPCNLLDRETVTLVLEEDALDAELDRLEKGLNLWPGNPNAASIRQRIAAINYRLSQIKARLVQIVAEKKSLGCP